MLILGPIVDLKKHRSSKHPNSFFSLHGNPITTFLIFKVRIPDVAIISVQEKHGVAVWRTKTAAFL